MKKPESVEKYIDAHPQWSEVLIPIREMLLTTGMNEQIKWMFPCYSDHGKNIVGLGTTKNYAAVWFFQGALLQDKLNVLINAQKNKTKAMRQWQIKDMGQLDLENLELYVYEAIENQRSGLQIKPDFNKAIVVPSELEKAFDENPQLKKAFNEFSRTNRRDFAEHIAGAKKEETRLRRLEKSIPMILSGVGLNDKYKKSKKV